MTFARPGTISLRPGDMRKGSRIYFAIGRRPGEPSYYREPTTCVVVEKPSGMTMPQFRSLPIKTLSMMMRIEARKKNPNVEPALVGIYGNERFRKRIRMPGLIEQRRALMRLRANQPRLRSMTRRL